MLITAIIFIILGIMVKHGKMYHLMAGYNSLSEEEKNKYDFRRIATLFRNVMFAMAAMIITGSVAGSVSGSDRIRVITLFASVIVGIPYLLIRVNSGKFKKNT